MRVFLFRGLAGRIFSSGIDQLSAKLNNVGHKATVHSWIERRTIQRKTIRECRSGAINTQIGLIGHSLGGNSANFMANGLVKAKIDVAYIATIDPTEPKGNPSGVNADNFRSRDFRAEKIMGTNDFYYPHLNHIQIDKDNKVHSRIVKTCTKGSDNSSKHKMDLPETTDQKLDEFPKNEILELLTALLQRFK